jgi:hypothetical protein
MPIDGDFSLQIDVATPAAKSTRKGQALFAFDQCVEYLMPNGSYLVRNPRTGGHGILTGKVLNAMTDCTVFRTMDEHIRHLTNADHTLKGHSADVQKVLESVQNDGLTINAAEICSRINADKTPLFQHDTPVLAIITWERPVALERLLKSIMQNRPGYADSPCYVIDDSRSDASRRNNQNIVDLLKADGWSSLVYLGAEQLAEILAGLLQRLPQHETAIRYLFDRDKWTDFHSAGVARNFTLFASVGRRLVVFDDDAVCDVFEIGNSSPGIRLGNVQREVDFTRDTAEWNDRRAVTEHDPVSRQAQLLGGTVGDALQTLGLQCTEESSLSGVSAASVFPITAESPIMITACGYLGDPGTASNRWIAKVSKASRARLLQTEEHLEAALTVRQVWLARDSYQFQSRFNMSPVTGVDNRKQLPPYVPVFRGQDIEFGMMVEFIFPGSVCLDLPWVVPHLPIEDRRRNIEDTEFFFSAEFPSFFDDFIARHSDACSANQPAERMAFLGRAFIDLARQPGDAILEMHKDHNIAAQSRHMQFLVDALAESGDAPALWRRLIKEAIDRASDDIRELIEQDGFTGYPEHLSDDQLLAFWRQFWEALGIALLAWPEIRAAAPEIMAGLGHAQ